MMYNFSVIIVCYNPDIEKLKYTINSIINQVDVSYEIIVADDGSKENYSEEIKSYFANIGFKDVIYSFSKENHGTVLNLYNAVQLARGEYVKAISPGDYLFDAHALKNYYDVFKKKRADMVFGKAQYYTTDMRTIRNSAPQNGLVFHNIFTKRDVMLYHDYILGASIAVKRELFEYLVPLLGNVKYLEDVPLTFLAFINKKRVIACNKKLIWYESGLGISTNKKTSSLLDNDYKAFYDYLSKFNDAYIRKVIKTYNILTNTDNRTKRFFKMFFCSPLYPFISAIRVLTKIFIKTSDLNKLYDIVNIDKGI